SADRNPAWSCSRSAGVRARIKSGGCIRHYRNHPSLAQDLYRTCTSQVAAQGEDLLARLHIPKLDGRILAPRCQPQAIGAEGHAVDHGSMAAQGVQLLAGLHVPDLQFHNALPGNLPAARRQKAAIWAESHAPDGM